jgi:hypothetical protein
MADVAKVRVTGPAGKVYDVIFIPLDAYLPECRDSTDEDELFALRWRAELHADLSKCDTWVFCRWPLAAAWIYIPALIPYFGDAEFVEGRAHVRWIEVPEALRRRGYATLLADGLRTRWPDVWFSDPCSEEGEGFLRSIREG